MIWEPTGSSFSFSVPGTPRSFITYGESVKCEERVNQMVNSQKGGGGTDLSIGDLYVLKSPVALRPVFQMTTVTQYPRGPTTDSRKLCGVSYFSI